MDRFRCPNTQCPQTHSRCAGIISYGFYQTRWGRRRRFRCKMCRRTFCRNSGTVYHRLQHRRATFDEVAALSVEGVNKSSIARVQQIAWNTVDRWLEKAAAACRQFNHQEITKIGIRELQAAEIRTMVGGKERSPVWIFAAIEVWSRLWPATVVGKRSYRNTLTLFRELCARSTGSNLPPIATDGFKFYRQVIRRLIGAVCLYGQFIKKRRNDRVVRVRRKARIGEVLRWNDVWRTSEDSRQLNTSYIERLNLTIGQGWKPESARCKGLLTNRTVPEGFQDHPHEPNREYEAVPAVWQAPRRSHADFPAQNQAQVERRHLNQQPL